MSKKLFSMEELDGDIEGVEVELETTPEEGEVADVEVEVAEDVAEIEDIETSVDEGVDAAEDLEEIQEVIEASLDEDGEGLDEISAEMARVAVKAICGRIGANPKAIYSLYAKENFESASSRRANSQIATEAVGDMLKDLWNRIKAAINSMWTKVKDFWAKHLSSLGRLKKAVASMEKKVNGLDKAEIETLATKKRIAPRGLVSIFPVAKGKSKGTFDIENITPYATGAVAVGKDVSKLEGLITSTTAGTDPATMTSEELVKKLQSVDDIYNLGTADAPLAGGTYFEVSIQVAEGPKVTINKERKKIEVDEDKDLVLTVITKEQLKKALSEASTIVTTMENTAKATVKKAEEYKKFENQMNKAVNTHATGDAVTDNQRTLSKVANAVSIFNGKLGSVSSLAASNQTRVVKGILAYCGLWVKGSNEA